MIGTDTLDRVIGADVYDADGDKIGTASEVFLDDESGNPEWVTVKTGLFGTKETFVPIRDADLTSNGVRVPVTKAAVKDAPKIDTDGHLSPQEEQELYRHYGFGTGGNTVGTDTTVGTGTVTTGRTDTTTTTGVVADTTRPATSGTTDDSMVLSEERLKVGTQQVETGRARLRKYVVTENVTQTVPVSHEEVHLQREAITDANVGGAVIGEEVQEVTLHAEQPVVAKEAVAVERIRLGTETVTENQTVTETVRKEQVDTDGIDTNRR